MSEDFELRFDRYLAFTFHGKPAVHDPGPAFRRWFSYQLETDCELPDWADRANGGRWADAD